LDCREYISKYVSAQADGELTPRERRAANEHLAKCASCRALLVEERSLKALIHSDAVIVRTPPDVRMRIRAAIGDMADPKVDREPSYPAQTVAWREATRPQRERRAYDDREGSTNRATDEQRAAARASRRRLWVSVGGVAATLIIAIAIIAGRVANQSYSGPAAPVPAFDMAIAKYLSMQRNFSPNVPPEAYSNPDGTVYAWVQNRDPVQRVSTPGTDAFDDVTRAYREMSMPDDVLDLSSAGYHLAGGRADRLADGRPITYTLYAGESGSILSICYRDASMAAPIGAINWLGMRSFYEYKGYSICMSFYPAGHFVSILVSRMPVTQLLNDVAASDSTIAGN
jgi:anti-sigma factor RsiW